MARQRKEYKMVRLEIDKWEELNILSDKYNKSMTELLGTLIHAEYKTLVGNPELEEVVQKLNELQQALEKMQNAETSRKES